jgi:signal transduction histidine kinase/CheY-like chemotaxis protein
MRPTPRVLSTSVACLEIFLIVGGLLSLAGWVLDVPRLTDWHDSGISIQPNTSLAVIAAGTALALLGTRFTRAAAFVGIVLSTIGATVIFQYLSGVDLGIDSRLMFERTWGRVGVTSPGRMGPAGATSWTLLGVGIIFASRPATSELRGLAPSVAVATASISALGLLGYLYGSSTLYSLPNKTAIALQTASFILAASVALMAKVPERGLFRLLSGDDAGGVLARRLFLPIVLIPILVGFLRLQGERAKFYDAPFGTAFRTLTEIILFGLLVWWAAVAINRHEQDLREAEREKQELLEKERAARADAERAARLKDEFLATLSHELRTPLNAIIGWSQILRRDLSNEERARFAVDVIERSGRRQAQLITDLLDISRIVSGNMRIDVQPVDLPTVIDAAIESILPASVAKTVRIERVAERISEPLYGDPSRLQQMVWNLLANAVKFTPRGGNVLVAVARVGTNVEIRVADSGEGIAPEVIPHIFERFRQGDASTSRRHGGLGLGLALVRQLAELHGGAVRAESEGLGNGATFTIELPLATVAETAHDAPRLTPKSLPTDGVNLKGIRVLIVDDEPDALAMVRRLLEENEANVRTADSTQAALELLGKQPFDVILSDIAMPGRDGYDLMTELRARGFTTPAVALTAFARPEDRERALESGYQMHISKPVEEAELLGAVVRWGARALN